MSTDFSPASPPDDRQRWVALVVLCVGMLMIVLDATIVNVALPGIQEDLGFSQSSLAWVVNAYLIAFGGLLLLSGRIGDLIGRRTMFLAGLTLFTVASLACGAAQTQEVLVVARFVQGAGGAMTSAVILGMIVTMFPEPREQAKAIGVYGFVASAGGSIGLLLGGVLTEAINWHWIFFVNLPIGVVTAFYARKLLVKDEGAGLREGADVPGAVLITGALMLLVYTIVKPAADNGWGDPQTLGLLAVGLALIGVFVAREHTARTPLMPLRIFRSRNLSGGNVVQALMVAGFFGQGFLVPLYLQKVLDYSPLQIGLAFLPMTLLMGFVSLRVSEPVITRYGAKATMIPGMALSLVAMLWLVRLPVDATYVVDLLPTMALFGVGAGFAMPALMGLTMSGAQPQDAGLASGLVNTTMQVGGAIGLAVLATLSTTRTVNLQAEGEPVAQALTSGYHLAFLIAAALLAAALAVTVGVLRSPAQAPAHEAAPAGDPAYQPA